MKYLVISDTHLGKRFSTAKFNYLSKIIRQADKVILAGDFWDGYLFSYSDFIDSKWKELFPLLIEKKAVFIPGNHDQLKKEQTEVPFACEITNEHTIKIGDVKYVIRHGHNVVPALDTKFPTLFAHHFVIRLGVFIESIAVKVFGRRFLKSRYWTLNAIAMRWAKMKMRDEDILVLGHTHLQKDAPSRNYINTGLFNYGIAQYLWITDKGHYLVNDRY